jgi:hypothetical protein
MKFRNIYERTNSFQAKQEFEDWIKEVKKIELRRLILLLTLLNIT